MHCDVYKVIVHVCDVLGLYKAAFTNHNRTNSNEQNIRIRCEHKNYDKVSAMPVNINYREDPCYSVKCLDTS